MLSEQITARSVFLFETKYHTSSFYCYSSQTLCLALKPWETADNLKQKLYPRESQSAQTIRKTEND